MKYLYQHLSSVASSGRNQSLKIVKKNTINCTKHILLIVLPYFTSGTVMELSEMLVDKMILRVVEGKGVNTCNCSSRVMAECRGKIFHFLQSPLHTKYKIRHTEAVSWKLSDYSLTSMSSSNVSSISWIPGRKIITEPLFVDLDSSSIWSKCWTNSMINWHIPGI